MKVYIDEKPENCDVCPCQSECWCNLTNQNIGYMNTKGKIPEDCPLELIAQHDKEKDQRIAELEEENKNLKLCRCCKCKSENEYMLQNTIRDLEEENAKLKERLDNPHDVWVENNSLTEINNWQNSEIKCLHEQLKNAIVPKFKVGQQCWFISDSGRIKDGIIKEICVNVDNDIFYRISSNDIYLYIILESSKRIFTTEAEAQKYLENKK